MKKYEDKPSYIQAFISDKYGIHIWDLPQTYTFNPSCFKNNNIDIDNMFLEVFSNGYELVCFDQHKSRYIFRLEKEK